MAKATGKSTSARKTPAKPAKRAPARAGTAKKATAGRRTGTAGKKATPAKAVKAKKTAKRGTAAPARQKATPAKKVAKATARRGATKGSARKVAKPKKVAKKAPPKKTAKAKATPKPKPKRQPAGKVCPLSGIFVPKQSPNISPKTLEKLRGLLIEERERHLRQATELQAEAEALVSEREQGDTQFDEESGEGDTISVERERDLMLSASARQAVDEIDQALARMEDGTYGLCTPAGRRIVVARLEAIPWADVCVDCKQRVERPRR
jgi:RNA polymerase-binding transcription factor DksA